jgi:hypothetical protein
MFLRAFPAATLLYAALFSYANARSLIHMQQNASQSSSRRPGVFHLKTDCREMGDGRWKSGEADTVSAAYTLRSHSLVQVLLDGHPAGSLYRWCNPRQL